MAKYIPDIKSDRWVILAPGRLKKPQATDKNYLIKKKDGLNVSPDCPFCPGNESQTPAEVDSIRKNHLWSVRAFPNLYPITDIHEVIIHTPDHLKDIPDMDQDELLNLFLVYQRRVKELRKEGVPILFRNKGVNAGTSIPHPHSQILVLPQQINLQALSLEPIKNIVTKNDFFITYCPDFSQYPYEIWIAHKECEGLEIGCEKMQDIDFTRFGEAELTHLGRLLQQSVKALEKTLGEFSYNYYFSPHPPFYLRLIPRLLTRGGFELGTGLSTNVLDPAEAAETLKSKIGQGGREEHIRAKLKARMG